MQTTTSEEEDQLLLTKLASGMVAIAWKNVLMAFAIGDLGSIKRSLRVFAATTGDTALTKTLEDWLKDVDNEKAILTTRQDLTQATKQSINSQITNKLIEMYLSIYAELTALMREKNYITFEPFQAKPKYPGTKKL